MHLFDDLTVAGRPVLELTLQEDNKQMASIFQRLISQQLKTQQDISI